MSNTLDKILYGGGIFFDITKWMLMSLVFLVLLASFYYSVFIVDGLSMEPNFHDKELVLLNKGFYRDDRVPKRGQTVVVRYPGDPDDARYVKRVIGLPGEEVTISGGRVYVDSKRLKETYLPLGTVTEPGGSWELEAGEYFLMGDNRENSNDSRYFGPVEKRFFVGRAAVIVYPRLRNLYLPRY